MSSKINKYRTKSKHFKIITRLNKGAFGVVYKVKDTRTNQLYAAKVIITEDEKDRELINREIQIMIRVVHPTLIGFRGFSLTDFQGDKNVTIYMELIERGSLQNLLEKAERSLLDSDYDNTSRQIILVGIAYGMMILHQHCVIHRDLKPGNILIDGNYYPHITDFGLSKIYNLSHSKTQTQNIGTPSYMAPEVVTSNRYDGKADVFSFGIIMFQVITEKAPYPQLEKGEITKFKLMEKVAKNHLRPKFDDTPIKKSLKKLIERCWDADPKHRPTFEEIFNRLAYNKKGSIYNASDEIDIFDEEDEEEEDDDEEKYYLEDVETDRLFNYIDIITENRNDNDDSEMIESLSKSFKKIKKDLSSSNQEKSDLIDGHEKAITKIKKDLSKNKDSIKSIKKDLSNCNKIISDQKIQIEQQKEIIANIQKEVSDCHELIENQNQEIHKKDEIIQELTEKVF